MKVLDGKFDLAGPTILNLVLCLLVLPEWQAEAVSWDRWWTYDGISGPSYWGLINPEWSLCYKGRRQSPIDIDPGRLLYDPNLRALHIDKHRVRGNITNTGHSVILKIDNTPMASEEEEVNMDDAANSSMRETGAVADGMSSNGAEVSDEDEMHQRNNLQHLHPHHRSMLAAGVPGGINREEDPFRGILPVHKPVNITGGPLTYSYQVEEIHLHYGTREGVGSEHTINGHAFPAEMQIFGYNAHLYSNFSEALTKSQGIVGIALLIQIGEQSNSELRLITDVLDKIKFGGQIATIEGLNIQGLLPNTDSYITYEGSITMPACFETVTWIVMNKPIYITRQQLVGLRQLMQGGATAPKAPLGNNFRPPHPVHYRPVRTNINFKESKETNKHCPTMGHKAFYQAAAMWSSP